MVGVPGRLAGQRVEESEPEGPFQEQAVLWQDTEELAFLPGKSLLLFVSLLLLFSC